MSAPSSTPDDAGRPAAARDVAKSYSGGIIALDGVDLQVEPGEALGLLGPNGSGKSTLLRILAGTLAPDRGEARIFGLEPASAEARSRTGFVAQEQALDPEMTGPETAYLVARLHGLGPSMARDRVRSALEAFGISRYGNKRVASYSGGMRQRLHLLLESLHGPRFLLLDEPTQGLDPDGKVFFWGWLGSLMAGGGAAVLALHDLDEAERRCGRVALMSGGRVRAVGAPDDLVRRHGCWFWKALLSRPPASGPDLRSRLSGFPGVRRVDLAGDTISFWVEDGAPGFADWVQSLETSGAEVRSIERRKPDLASVYSLLLGEPGAGDGTAAEKKGTGTGRGNGNGPGGRGGGKARGGAF